MLLISALMPSHASLRYRPADLPWDCLRKLLKRHVRSCREFLRGDIAGGFESAQPKHECRFEDGAEAFVEISDIPMK